MRHCLAPDQPTLAEPIDARIKELSRRWKLYLKVNYKDIKCVYNNYYRLDGRLVTRARRVLGIELLEDRTVLKLPHNYLRRLQRVGLCLNPAETAKFQHLDPCLQIDAACEVFAQTRPYLIGNVKRMLTDELPWRERAVFRSVGGSCSYLQHSSEPDPPQAHIQSPFKIAPATRKPERPTRYEPSEGDDEW
jgi:hypothetical protein